MEAINMEEQNNNQKQAKKETTKVLTLRVKESTYKQLMHMSDYLGLSVNKIGSTLLDVGVSLGIQK